MKIRFSTDDIAPEDREPIWRDLISQRMFSLTPGESPDRATFRGCMEAYVAGSLILSEVQTPYRRLRRTSADLARDGTVRFGLSRVPAQTELAFRLTHATREVVRQEPGDFLLASSEWSFETAGRDSVSSTMLLVPHERLAPLLAGGRLTRPVRIPADSAMGALLDAGFSAAQKHAPKLAPELGEAVLQNLCNLAALACGAAEPARADAANSVREIRLAAAKRHIRAQLGDPALTPASAAASLGISVRQLHLLFEPGGESFSQYVTRMRLEACRAALSNPAEARRAVADIAYGWGFDSLSSFYRAFHRAFGVAPGELRARRHASAQHTADQAGLR